MKDLNDKVVDIIFKESGVDIRKKSRLRHVVEYRDMYFYIMRRLDPKMPLRCIGETVDKNHATVLHGIKMYSVFERYNPSLARVKNRIFDAFFINDEHELDKDVEESQVKYLKSVISNLEDRLEKKIETSDVKNYDFKIVNQINELLLEHRDRPSYDVLVMKLEAFLNLNSKIVVL
tara:strand:- start:2401 stop:2928 length:528 start_codon:yes stop_codon:yes gene_type:complete